MRRRSRTRLRSSAVGPSWARPSLVKLCRPGGSPRSAHPALPTTRVQRPTVLSKLAIKGGQLLHQVLVDALDRALAFARVSFSVSVASRALTISLECPRAARRAAGGLVRGFSRVPLMCAGCSFS